MNNTGSLIQIHHHNNFETLEQITDYNGTLYYKDAPILYAASDEEIEQAIIDTIKILNNEGGQ